MGKRGPKPKPTVLKLAEGVRADRVNAAEPRPRKGPVAPPEHLDEHGRAEWARIAPELEAMGVLSPADAPALAIYCEAFSRWLRARAEIKDHGLVVKTASGSLKTNPAAAIAGQCESTMRGVLSSFGLDPASRSRVKVEDHAAERDPMAEFLSRRNNNA